jgi:Uncharacterized protein conserved in bacteria
MSIVIFFQTRRPSIPSQQPSQRPRSGIKIAVIIFVLALACLTVLMTWRYGRGARGPIAKIISSVLPTETKNHPKNNTNQKAPPVITALYKKLSDLEVRPTDISQSVRREKAPTDSLIAITAHVPRGRPLEWIVWNVSQAAQGTTYRLSDCLLDEKKQVSVLTFVSDRSKAAPVELTLLQSDKFFSFTAKMAIIGEIGADTSYQTIVAFLSVPEQVSISLVPVKKQSALIAQLAEQYHKEVILRLPLEPTGKIPSDFAGPVIMVHYTKEAIHSIIAEAMAKVPNFSGFNNLWGSRALEDSRIMGIVCNEIKKAHGYFIETCSTKNSVVPSLCESIGLPAGEIDATLNDKSKQVDFEKQLRNYAAAAQANGTIIVAAPINAPFIAALKASVPVLKRNGIRLVPVSEIVIHKEL